MIRSWNPAARQRVWHRVEDARAPQGHRLEATSRRGKMRAFQLRDGSWKVEFPPGRNGHPSYATMPDWSDVLRAFSLLDSP